MHSFAVYEVRMKPLLKAHSYRTGTRMQFSYTESTQHPSFDDTIQKLATYRGEIKRIVDELNFSVPESALALPYDTALCEQVKATALRLGKELKLVLVVGIGGSDLGARAVYDALFAHLDPLTPHRLPKLIFLESVEPDILERIDAHIGQLAPDVRHIAVVVASKSGTTTETRVNAAVIGRALVERYGQSARERLVVVTQKDTHLWTEASLKGVQTLTIPAAVSGRFSIFSSAGLLPIALAGINIDTFLEGARQGVEKVCGEDAHNNYAMVLATLLYLYANDGIRVHDLFLFHTPLESIGKWYRQLLAESIGKEVPETGQRVGITPVVAIGTTDLHSLVQLVFAGPRERFTTFVAAPGTWGGPSIPTESEEELLGAPAVLSGRRAGLINEAIFEGVKRAYKQEGLPFVETTLEDISASELAEFMALHMGAVMYLGKLFGVNTFDQPAVETYKREVRNILESNH